MRSDIAVHQREQERAAGRIGLHQGADIDVALRDDAVEGSDHALVGLLLIEHAQLRFLRHDIGLRDVNRRISCLQGQAIGIALLRGDPALLHQAGCRGPR